MQLISLFSWSDSLQFHAHLIDHSKKRKETSNIKRVNCPLREKETKRDRKEEEKDDEIAKEKGYFLFGRRSKRKEDDKREEKKRRNRLKDETVNRHSFSLQPLIFNHSHNTFSLILHSRKYLQDITFLLLFSSSIHPFSFSTSSQYTSTYRWVFSSP